jgi:hypothetical protein
LVAASAAFEPVVRLLIRTAPRKSFRNLPAASDDTIASGKRCRMNTNRCAEEIVTLHQFFEAWYTGRLPPTEEAFARLEQALAEGFHMITPNGRIWNCREVLDWVHGGHGGRDPSFRIHIRNPVSLAEAGGLVLAAYEEWQESAGELTGRLSTVVFREREEASGGLQWLHVHETAMPDEEQMRVRRRW